MVGAVPPSPGLTAFPQGRDGHAPQPGTETLDEMYEMYEMYEMGEMD